MKINGSSENRETQTTWYTLHGWQFTCLRAHTSVYIIIIMQHRRSSSYREFDKCHLYATIVGNLTGKYCTHLITVARTHQKPCYYYYYYCYYYVFRVQSKNRTYTRRAQKKKRTTATTKAAGRLQVSFIEISFVLFGIINETRSL